MKDQRICFETAKLARQKGFSWKPFKMMVIEGINDADIPSDNFNYCYNEEGKEITPKYYNLNNEHYPRPTQALLAKWLREKHNLHVTPYVNVAALSSKYSHAVLSPPQNVGKVSYLNYISIGPADLQFDTYEEAMEYSLSVALKTLKDK